MTLAVQGTLGLRLRLGSGPADPVTDPNSRIATVAYDSGRAGLDDHAAGRSSAEKFVADQEAGWTNSGTALSPAAATLLAQAASSYADPAVGNVTTVLPRLAGPEA